MEKKLEDYNVMQQGQIRKAGSIEAWKEGLRKRAAKGGAAGKGKKRTKLTKE